MEKPDKETLKLWLHDCSNWRWGIIYYNKKDKRIFPPKKYRGFGWTVNFANPFSILAFLAIILLLITIVVLITMLIRTL
jgi:uncharacterized membrane protein